jgi:hypothetical protein
LPPPDGISIQPGKINRLLLYLWQQEISKDGIRICNYLFNQDRRIWFIVKICGMPIGNSSIIL